MQIITLLQDFGGQMAALKKDLTGAVERVDIKIDKLKAEFHDFREKGNQDFEQRIMDKLSDIRNLQLSTSSA